MKPVLMALGVSVAVGVVGGEACGQSLYEREVHAASRGEGPSVGVPLSEVSIYSVEPPQPREFQKHDLVEIIINETSSATIEQSLETEKNYDLNASLLEFPSIRHLLEAQLRSGDMTPIVEAQAELEKEFEGEGDYERTDRVQARIMAKVIDVKPNGNLILEARETVQNNEEITTMVLAGEIRGEDVTEQNTVQSSKVANMILKIENEGEVKRAAEKGIIAQVLDAIFNF